MTPGRQQAKEVAARSLGTAIKTTIDTVNDGIDVAEYIAKESARAVAERSIFTAMLVSGVVSKGLGIFTDPKGTLQGAKKTIIDSTKYATGFAGEVLGLETPDAGLISTLREVGGEVKDSLKAHLPNASDLTVDPFEEFERHYL